MTNPPPINVSKLSFHYQGNWALDDVNFSVEPGTLTAIIGPNGAGKSTLLKNILGLLTPNSGTVEIFGRTDWRRQRSHVVYVPQRSTFDWSFPITVLEVALQGLYPAVGRFGRITRAHRARAAEALAHVGMTEFAEHQVSELSGGQQQRVFLARAIAQDGDLMILDEPFAGIDYQTEELLVQLFQTFKRAGKTLLVVHHDLSTVEQIFDRVILLNQTVKAQGPVSLMRDRDLVQSLYRIQPDLETFRQLFDEK